MEGFGGQRCPGACRVWKGGDVARWWANVSLRPLGGQATMITRVHGSAIVLGNP